MTHCWFASLMSSARFALGRARFTMEASSTTMSWLRAMKIIAFQRSGSFSPACGTAGAVVMRAPRARADERATATAGPTDLPTGRPPYRFPPTGPPLEIPRRRPSAGVHEGRFCAAARTEGTLHAGWGEGVDGG